MSHFFRAIQSSIARKTLLGAVGVTAILAATPAAAIDYTAIFAKTGQSVYAPGPATGFDTGTRRLGPAPFSHGDTYGGFFDPCPVFSCKTGAQAGAKVSGNIGLNYGVKFDAGSFDAAYPVNVHLSAPTPFANAAGSAFHLTSSYDIPGYNGAGGTGIHIADKQVLATLQTHSPTVQAFVDLDAEIHAFVGAEACVAGVCQGPALGPFDANASRNLVAFNRNGDKLIRVGDTTVMLDTPFNALDGNLTGRLSLPSIDAVSSPTRGSTAGNLTTYGRDNVITLGANVSNLISQSLGIPLNGEIQGIGYDLLNVSAGLSLDLKQTLSLQITPFETYNFLNAVQQQLGDGSWSAPTFQITAPLGSDLTLRSNALSLGVIPLTRLAATLTNSTSLVIGGDVGIRALAANVFGLDIGPLYDSGSVNGGLFEIPLFNNSFALDFGTILGGPFNIRQSLNPTILADPGYAAILQLLGADPTNPSLQQAEIRVSNLSQCAQVANFCPSFHYADASPSALTDTGLRAFLSDTDALNVPTVIADDPESDAQQLALLAAAGFSSELAPLNPPLGTPFSVPEPGTWTLLLLGFGLVGGGLRSARARRLAPA